ncbi:polyprenyl synthetase [Paenibacillus albiflavus]|uniref:Polyprenyl synthetase n=1 Tax=Paenibacillus albiflavus TaxID=2545760 RepID=A0A4R4E964_9BACL|nr:polyprenyl synthetase family protein [Paenibacillus albiflavus]TCZ76366.1 polyprenyl synthetase [Paenibacillus albiflavus]
MNKRMSLEQFMRGKINQYFIQSHLRALATSFLEYKLTESFIFSDLTRLHYQMLGGTSQEIEKAGAAVELMVLALDIYDDLQDRDNLDVPWSQVDPAQALNVAIGLQSLSIATLDDCAFSNSSRTRAMRYLNHGILRSVNGQHTDLLNYVNEEEDCLHMIRNKSGSLIACACLIGATLVTDEHHELIAQYGQSIGTIGQIRNDIKGISRWDLRNDLLNRKRTLPILYFLDHDHPIMQIVRDYYEGYASQTDLLSIKNQIIDLIESSGSKQYAEVILRTLQYEAKELIEKLPIEQEWKQKIVEFVEL